MISSKEQSETINFKVISKKMSSIDQLFKQPEFQKIINQVTAKSSSDREAFANAQLEPESLSRNGIEVPKGLKIKFRPAKEDKPVKAAVPVEGKIAPPKKKLNVGLLIPGVGTILIHTGIRDKPAINKEES